MKSFLNPPDGAAPFMLKNFKAILNKIGASTSKSGLAKFECTFNLSLLFVKIATAYISSKLFEYK